MFAAENLIQKCSKNFRDAFLNSVDVACHDLDKLEKLNNSNSLNNISQLESIELENYLNSLTQFKTVVMSAITIASKEAEKPSNRQEIHLNLENTINVQEANRISTNLIYDLSSTQREVVKKIIADGLEKNLSYKIISQKLKSQIGLNAPQIQTLQTIESNLLSNGTSKTVVERILTQKSKQMLALRAQTIALTESGHAVSQGRYLIQQQMFRDGDIKHNSTQEWLTGSDERTCSICGPMNGQKVGLKDYFTTGAGQLVRNPILHPRCRCIVVINF